MRFDFRAEFQQLFAYYIPHHDGLLSKLSLDSSGRTFGKSFPCQNRQFILRDRIIIIIQTQIFTLKKLVYSFKQCEGKQMEVGLAVIMFI